MALTRSTMIWHAGSMAAGGVAVFAAMASQQIDVYAIWNSLNKIVADVTTLVALLAPVATIFGAAYRTWNAKQVPVTAIALQPTAVDPGPTPHETIVTGKVVGALLFALLLFGGAPSAFAQQPKPVSILAPPLSQLLTKLIADAQAASDDAKQHSDVIAQTCYDAIVVVASQQVTALAAQSGTIGPILVLQKARDIGRLSSTPQGTALVVGCAPLVQDAKLNMVQFFANIGGTVLIKGLLIP